MGSLNGYFSSWVSLSMESLSRSDSVRQYLSIVFSVAAPALLASLFEEAKLSSCFLDFLRLRLVFASSREREVPDCVREPEELVAQRLWVVYYRWLILEDESDD